MALTKSSLVAMTTGMSWCSGSPVNPIVGNLYMDTNSMTTYIWDGNNWVQMNEPSIQEEPKPIVPTQEQLDKYPALKQSWEEYVVIKKLLGL